MTSRHSWKTVGLTLAPLLVLVAAPVRATTINFDNLSAGTALSNQYAGVTFNGSGNTGAHISVDDVSASSPPNVLINSPLSDQNSGGPLTMTFSPTVQSVSLSAGYFLNAGSPNTLGGTLLAYDQTGTLIPGAAMSATVTGAQTSTPFSVSSPQANIALVTLDLGQGIYTTIDDLTFTGAATPPPGGGPTITLTAPVDGSTIDVTNSSLAVTGTVSGQQLAPNVQVTLQALFSAPNQTTPTVLTATLPLDSTQTSFSGPNAFTNVPVGIYKLTATVTSMAGSASAHATVNNIPFALGVTPSEFQYSQPGNGGECQFVAYQDTSANPKALAYFPTTSQVIPLNIAVLAKWQGVYNPTILHGDGTLGCPLPLTTTTLEPPAMAGSLASAYEYQVIPFERGSVYFVSTDAETLPVVPLTYTPKVFVNAINQLSTFAQGFTPFQIDDPGGINEVGVAVADPTFDLVSGDPTLLYQQFARPWYVARDSAGDVLEAPTSHAVTAGLPNTLEIRDESLNPTLWVERIGGSRLDYQAAFLFRNTQVANNQFVCNGVCNVPVPNDLTPTVWERYGCEVDPATNDFLCAVDHPKVQAFTSQTNTPVYTTQSEVPDDTGYCSGVNDCESIPLIGDLCEAVGIALQGTTEWSAIPVKTSPSSDVGIGDFAAIQATGWVVASNAANTDFPATHEHMQGSDTGTEIIGTGAGCVLIPEVGCLLGNGVANQVGGMEGLWSDWGIHVRPLALDIGDPNQGFVKTPAVGGLPTYWNLLASNGDPTQEGTAASPIGAMEMEWEEFWEHPWLAASGSTVPIGAIVFANGRWMIDCSHPPVHSEIHPPDSVMWSIMAPDTTHGFVNGVGTTAQMWVNELYQGILYETQVWPPPRPSPTSQLSVVLNAHGGPKTQNPDGSVTFKFTPSQNAFASLPPEELSIAQATIFRGHSGLAIDVQGPSTQHSVKPTGQVMFPDDHPDMAKGPISNLYGTWTVGWQGP